MLRPASPGTGVIAGGAVRIVLEMAGVENALGKQIKSKNALNNARATVVAVQKMRQFDQVALQRGIPKEELWKWSLSCVFFFFRFSANLFMFFLIQNNTKIFRNAIRICVFVLHPTSICLQILTSLFFCSHNSSINSGLLKQKLIEFRRNRYRALETRCRWW